MSDLSDPNALPDEVREKAKAHLDQAMNLSTRYIESEDGEGGEYEGGMTHYEVIDLLTPILAAHFAIEHEGLKLDLATVEATAETQVAELDGLRAQIEEAKKILGMFVPVEHFESILAQSPRGTVAHIQAGALEAAAAKCASFEAAEFMRREAAAIREGAGQ